MLEKDGIVYEILQSKDLASTIECLATVFPGGEPLTHCLGITKEYYYPVAEIVCQKAVEDGLSHIAKDAQTGELVGFIISEDMYIENNYYKEKYKEFDKFIPIISLVESLQQEYLADKKIRKGQFFYESMIGVYPKYQNRNIARYLYAENIEYAKTKNFSRIITEPSGIVSQRLCSRFGFKEIVSIDYQDYEYQGMKVFANITRHKKCVLMEKIL
ncbi:MAG: GNAT family N-acetyltransferase [Nostocaceae cyanobacterium]|nr:GNAT family N-acetyltransferase [Nostocaceae cyanobacterium]